MSAVPAAPTVMVVGEINPDIVVTGVPAMSFDQREDLVGPTTMTVGSSVAISACGLARLGTATTIVGVVGDDAFGDFMLDRLRRRGVDVALVRTVAGGRTGSSTILVRAEDAGDRQILTDAGVMGDLRADDLPLGDVAPARHLHVGSWFLHTGAVHDLPGSLARARALGMTTSVDPNDDPAQQWTSHLGAALPDVDVLFVNEAEARGVAAADGGRAAGSAHDAARHLLGRLAPGGTVVLKAGPDGAFAFTAGGVLHVRAPRADVVDTVGAGDSLSAAYLHARLAGASDEAALRLAVAAGTLSTRRSGGVDGQPTVAEATALADGLLCTRTAAAATPAPSATPTTPTATPTPRTAT